MCDYYKILGLKPDATCSEVAEAYHNLIKECSSDKASNKTSICRLYFEQVQRAFQTLSNANKRRIYDTYLSNQRILRNLKYNKSSTQSSVPNKSPQVSRVSGKLGTSTSASSADDISAHSSRKAKTLLEASHNYLCASSSSPGRTSSGNNFRKTRWAGHYYNKPLW